MSWLGLEDKVGIVTGGGAGIGRAVCVELARQGMHVVVADIVEASGKDALAELTGMGGEHMYLSVNVTSRQSVEQMVDAIVARFGHIDLLVNNAGVATPRLLVDPAGKEELTEDIWDRTMNINAKGTYLCAQAVARHMIRAGIQGVILNMASESGLEGSAGQSVYAATKAAQYSLTRSWAKELGTHGIRVVGLAPGILETTSMRSESYERALAYTRGTTVEAMRKSYGMSGIPLGRPGTLQEVAQAVCFMASSRASYVNGTVLNVSGGKSRA